MYGKCPRPDVTRDAIGNGKRSSLHCLQIEQIIPAAKTNSTLRRDQMKFTSDPQIAKGKVLHIVFPTLLSALLLLAAIAPASAQSSAYADNFGNSASIEG